MKVASVVLGLIIGVLAAVPASAWDRTVGQITNLVLPALVDANGKLTSVRARAEGLTVGTDNNVYAASNGGGGIANLFVIDPSGNFLNGGVICAPPALQCSVRIQGSSDNVLGIRFNPNKANALWVLDSGNIATGGTIAPQILEVNPADGTSTRLAIPFLNDAVLNGITFDEGGNAYVSDSFHGRIYRIPVGEPAKTHIWSEGKLLKPADPASDTNPNGITPPFGANGIEFSPLRCTPGVGADCRLYVANTANRQILRIHGSNDPKKAEPPTVVINGVNAPDGIAIDSATNFIWVAANQSDEIVVIQPSTGDDVLARVIAKLGDFNNINEAGRVRGLLFPTSLAFATNPAGEKVLWVANSAFTSAFAVDTEWANLVTRFTVARIPVPAATQTGCPANPVPLPPPCGFFPP